MSPNRMLKNMDCPFLDAGLLGHSSDELVVVADEVRFASPPGAKPLRCLWLARDLPYPLDTGMKVYSANLAAGLAAAGAHVRFLGFGDAGVASAAEGRIDWGGVLGGRRRQVVALWSLLPVAAAIDATTGYRRMLHQELCKPWDAIVFDSYGTGWMFPICVRLGRNEAAGRPVLAHVSHNNEARLWADMARDAKCSFPKRVALRRNSLRIAELERSLIADADLVTAITDEDNRAFAGKRIAARMPLTLSPGYTGAIAPERLITATTPRRVVLMGSFSWIVKRENLIRLLAIADPAFAAAGITLDVVGEVPGDLLERLRSRSKASVFHGFVADPAPFLANARLALVPELIGGGFKLKFLDYFFGRVPVATIAAAAAGLPARIRAQTLQSEDLESLVAAVVTHIDETQILNGMQQKAFEYCRDEFRWEDRGQQMLAALEQLRNATRAVNTPAMHLSRKPVHSAGN